MHPISSTFTRKRDEAPPEGKATFYFFSIYLYKIPATPLKKQRPELAGMLEDVQDMLPWAVVGVGGGGLEATGAEGTQEQVWPLSLL